jgi:hypothetical protein
MRRNWPRNILWGIQTDVDAGASVMSGGFDDRDLLSVRGSATSSSGATTTASNEHDVVLFGKLDWGHPGRVECSRDLAKCAREGWVGGETGERKKKPGTIFGEGTAGAVGERGGGEPGLECSGRASKYLSYCEVRAYPIDPCSTEFSHLLILVIHRRRETHPRLSCTPST